MFWRKKKSDIPFGLIEGNQTMKMLQHPKRVYWLCNNPKKKGWVVLLHSWGRRSDRMVKQAEVYWERGYSLVFVDARSHGLSQYTIITTGYHYALDVKEILEKESIKNPIVHGLSFGAIASTILAQKYDVRALVLEAVTSEITTIYDDFLRVTRIPKIIYGWIPWLLLKKNWPWEELAPINSLQRYKGPIFLIHGEKDDLFPYEQRVMKVWEKLKHRDNVFIWIVPESSHSRMAEHPEFKKRLNEFLDFVENQENK